MVSKIKHCDDWFEPSQCFVLTIAMNSLDHRSVERELYILRDMHLIKYVGSNKTGHWEVVTE